MSINEDNSNEIFGYIHSYETFGAVDGPGVRFIVFMQGCSLRCLFCHNADTWNMSEGEKTTPQELFDKIIQYKNFIKKGGVTFSGGEPLLQHEFICEVIKLCKKAGLHTAIDTSGGISLDICKAAIDAADMILLDIKDIDSDDCEKLTGQTNANALAILNYCDYVNKDVWIRHVLIPQYTMDNFKLYRLARVLSWYSCIKKVEIIPFHKMGEYKWDYVSEEYKLKNVPAATQADVDHAKEIMKQYALPQ